MDIPEELKPNPIVRKFKILLDRGECVDRLIVGKQEVTYHFKDGRSEDLSLVEEDQNQFDEWVYEFNLFQSHYVKKEHGCYTISKRPSSSL